MYISSKVFQIGTKVLFIEDHDDTVVFAAMGATGTVEAGSKSQKALTDPNVSAARLGHRKPALISICPYQDGKVPHQSKTR